jgi:FkbM family methyltransferase
MRNRTITKYKNYNMHIYDASLNDHFISYNIRHTGFWEEPQIIQIIHSLEYNNKAMIDVGANIGVYPLALSKFFKTIYAFEPNKEDYELLIDSIRDNSIYNIKTYNKACGNINSKCDLEIPDMGRGINISSEGNIDLIKLDDHIDDNIGFIKIDVEGFEFEVLKGLDGIITTYSPVIYLETHPTIIPDSLINCETWLMEHGYSVYYQFAEFDKLWKKVIR